MSFEMEVTDNMITLRIPMDDPPKLSKSEKSIVIASSRGTQKMSTKIDGKAVRVGFNIFIPVKADKE